MTLKSNEPIAIVGGGIIGLLCARELASAGGKAIVLDRQAVGRESSWAGGGILSPLNPADYDASVLSLSRWSQDRYARLCAELAATTGIDPEYVQSGLIRAYTDGEHAEGMATLWNSPARLLQNAELAGMEPEVKWANGRAVIFDAIAQVRNPRLLRSLIADVQSRGVVIRESTGASGFESKNSRLTGIRTSAGMIETRCCIVATGAWSGELLRDTGLDLSIEPVRGQMLLFRSGKPLLSHIVLQGGNYLIPRLDGRVLAGSTLEFAGFDKSTTVAARKTLYDSAVKILPALAKCEIEAHWAGLRPGTPKGIPYIGEHREIRGLFVCTGHYRNGLVLAPASAHLMADLVLGRNPILNPGPYRLDRP